MCNLFLWCLGCLIKLKAAVSGQWPLTFPDVVSNIFVLRSVAAQIYGITEPALTNPVLIFGNYCIVCPETKYHFKNAFCGNNLKPIRCRSLFKPITCRFEAMI